MIEALIARLFLAREIAHRAHLRTDSYARHMALGDFYGAIVERADAIAEAWMGRTGAVLGDVPILSLMASPDSIIEDLEALRNWVDQNRASVSDAIEIQNLIDEAVSTFDSTLYKLRRFA